MAGVGLDTGFGPEPTRTTQEGRGQDQTLFHKTVRQLPDISAIICLPFRFLEHLPRRLSPVDTLAMVGEILTGGEEEETHRSKTQGGGDVGGPGRS
jgi:hypothetical protein